MKHAAILCFSAFFLMDIVFAQNDNQNKEILMDTLNEVVVTSLLRPEKIIRAPASVQVLLAQDFKNFSGSNVGELLATVQGVEFTRYGVDGITFNARGLNSAFNNKVLQIVDGRISTSALSGGLPVFNNGSTIKDDIQQMEIILGPQSALFGPNAHNGVFNTITKDPRKFQGTSVSLSAGNQYQFSGRFRHAQKINNSWAWKVSGEYAAGQDFNFIDSVYVANPAKAIPEHQVDFNFKHLRGEAHLYYNINPKTELIVSGGVSSNDFIQVTTSGRNQMQGLTYSFVQARLVNPHFYANIYNTWGSLGDSYNITSYTQTFWTRTQPGNAFLPPDEAEQVALASAGFKEKSRRFNADFQYHTNFPEIGLFLVGGLDFENSCPNTGNGTNVVGQSGEISISQIGAVVQIEKTLMPNIRAIGAIRFDKNDNFNNLWAPKLTLVKDFSQGNIRLGWAKAYALPSIQNQYAGIRSFLFGNGGEGISYIPNTASVNNPAAILYTQPLKPEEVNTWELGFKGKPVNKVWVDANLYYGTSKNFITPALPVGGRALSVNGINVTHNPIFAGTVTNDTLRGANFITFFNYGKAKVYGLDVGTSYSFSPTVELTLKYSWLNADFDENDANKDGIISPAEKSINAPNHKGMAQLAFQNLCKNRLSFLISSRMVKQYDFYSGNQVGSEQGAGTRIPPTNFNRGALGGFTTFDLTTVYQWSKKVSFNFNITNMFNTSQIEFVGSPSIGRLVMASITITD